MLAKNPKYHITLIEAQPHLLNGASCIASRLHLGGEYPLDTDTASVFTVTVVMLDALQPDPGVLIDTV